MFIFGVIPFVVLLSLTIHTIIDALKSGDISELTVLIYPSIFIAITGTVTINFVLSILEITKVIPPLHKSTPKLSKEQKNAETLERFPLELI